MKSIFILIAVLPAMPLYAGDKPPQDSSVIKAPKPTGAHFTQGRLTIQKADSSETDIAFNIELAVTAKQHAQGMMYRAEMADNEGMLFIFSSEVVRHFWMKNTLIPLDMLFASRDGTIHHIHHDAIPQDLTRISSVNPSYAVLEIKGGMADTLGIHEGDKLIHSVFK